MKKKFFDAPYVITQKQKEFEDQNILGHKGLEYFKLSEKAKISPFFILTTTAFDHFVQSSLLVDPIVDQICKVDINDPESTDKASKNISDILNKASLPSIILNPLKVAFDSIKQDKNVYFKIIPSFIFSEKFIPKEAPNFEMNISSFENLLEQIKHGWSFLFSKEALLLRAQNFYQGNLSIALIIQKIVNPEASGNAKFMPNKIEINAFFGCQHPEIAGADKYIVEENQITEKYIVPQDKLAIRVFKDPNKKYKIIELEEEYRGIPKLTDNLILEIANFKDKISPFNLTTWEIEAGEVYLTNFEQQEFIINETQNNQSENINKPKPQDVKVKPKITVKENILNEAQITNTNTKINFSNFKIKNILDFSSMKPEIIADVERFDGGYFDGTTLILDRHELPEEKYSNEIVKASKFIDAIKLDINTAYKVTSQKYFFYKLSDIGDLEKKLLDSNITFTHDERILKNPMSIFPEINALKEIKKNSGSLDLILPSVRSLENLLKIKKQLASSGIRKNSKIRFFVETYIPLLIYEVDKIDQTTVDGVIIPLHKLGQTHLNKSILETKDYTTLFEILKIIINELNKNLKIIIDMDFEPNIELFMELLNINPFALIWRSIPNQEITNTLLELENKPKNPGRKLKPLFQH